MELTVQIKWTLRISRETKDVFSCTGETYYILNCTKGQNPSGDLDLVIGTSSFNVEMKWKSETTPIPFLWHRLCSECPYEWNHQNRYSETSRHRRFTIAAELWLLLLFQGLVADNAIIACEPKMKAGLPQIFLRPVIGISILISQLNFHATCCPPMQSLLMKKNRKKPTIHILQVTSKKHVSKPAIE